MLTRAAVAKRLGKSIATVRRLEGKHLFPFRDHRGVHRFSETQVDMVLDLMKSGTKLRGAQDEWLKLSPSERRRRRPLVPRTGGAERRRVRDAQREVAAMVVNLAGKELLSCFPTPLTRLLARLLEQ